MTLNQRIIALTEEVNSLISKDTPIVSTEFIKLAMNVMNLSDLTDNLNHLEQEERKEAEFEWIWKGHNVDVKQVQAPVNKPPLAIADI